MRRILLSTATANRLDLARRWFSGLGPGGGLILGATRRAADDFARALAEAQGHLLGVHTAQLAQLARELAAETLAERRRTPVSALGHRALAARAVFAVQNTRGLDYWAPIHHTPGFPKALARTLLELRLAGLGAEDLSEAGAACPPDLALLLSSYERVLAESELTDQAGVYSAAISAAAALRRPPIGLPLLIVDTCPTSRLEEQLLRALVFRAPSSAVCLHPHDEHALETYRTILGSSVELVAEEEPGSSRLSRIRRSLFQLSPASPAASAAEDGFTLFSAASEVDECTEIARRVLWLAEAGHHFDEVAVLLRDPETYGPFLRDAFRRAGVPAFFTKEAKRPEPAGRALLALLECASEGHSATRFAEYLSLGQAPAPQRTEAGRVRAQVPWVAPRDMAQLVFETAVLDEVAPSALELPVSEARAPIHWERLLVDASVIGQRPRWSRRLRGLEEELQLQLRELPLELPERDEIERRLEGLRRLQSFALPIIEFLASLPSRATWGAWLDFLGELATMALAQPELVLATLAELRPMAKIGPVSLDEVREVLRSELAYHRSEDESVGGRFGRVFVAGIEEAAGRSFEIVFVPGLAEGAFPKKVEEDPLLLDDARVHIDPSLETRETRTRRERRRLQLAVSAARSELIASFPRLERSEGRARVPSFYALDLIRAAEGALPDIRTLEARALASAALRIGWPAPTRPEVAIDETEHDLSVLAELLERPPEESRGRARHLLDSSAELGRSLRARGRRWLPTWRSVDGLVDPDPTTLSLLEAHRLGRRGHTSSALEQYAACPYRFFLHSVHGLRPRITPTRPEALDPLTRSSIEREVQIEILRGLSQNLPPGALPEPDSLLAELDRLFGEVAARHEERLAPAIPKVWRRGLEQLQADLRGWVRDLAAGQERPTHWALEFGPDTKRPVSLFGAHLLSGSIDLVERDAKTNGHWSVHLDGEPPPSLPVRTIGRGERLRPVLEALVLEALLEGPVLGGRTFHASQRGGYRRVDVALSEGARKAAETALKTIDRALEVGFLPQAPRRGACRQCQYRLICGPSEETRVSFKDRGRMTPLTRLRQVD